MDNEKAFSIAVREAVKTAAYGELVETDGPFGRDAAVALLRAISSASGVGYDGAIDVIGRCPAAAENVSVRAKSKRPAFVCHRPYWCPSCHGRKVNTLLRNLCAKPVHTYWRTEDLWLSSDAVTNAKLAEVRNQAVIEWKDALSGPTVDESTFWRLGPSESEQTGHVVFGGWLTLVVSGPPGLASSNPGWHEIGSDPLAIAKAAGEHWRFDTDVLAQTSCQVLAAWPRLRALRFRSSWVKNPKKNRAAAARRKMKDELTAFVATLVAKTMAPMQQEFADLQVQLADLRAQVDLLWPAVGEASAQTNRRRQYNLPRAQPKKAKQDGLADGPESA